MGFRMAVVLAVLTAWESTFAANVQMLLCEEAPCRELAEPRDLTISGPVAAVRYRMGTGLDVLLAPGFDTIFTPSKFPAANMLSLLYPGGRALLFQLAPWDYKKDRVHEPFEKLYFAEKRGSKIYYFTDPSESQEQGAPVQKALIQNARLPEGKILILSSIGFDLHQIEQMLSTLEATPADLSN